MAASPSPSSASRLKESPKSILSKSVAFDSKLPQKPISASSSVAQVTHSWFVSVDSVSFINSSQKVSVKDVRVVIKVPPAATLREFI